MALARCGLLPIAAKLDTYLLQNWQVLNWLSVCVCVCALMTSVSTAKTPSARTRDCRPYHVAIPMYRSEITGGTHSTAGIVSCSLGCTCDRRLLEMRPVATITVLLHAMLKNNSLSTRLTATDQKQQKS